MSDLRTARISVATTFAVHGFVSGSWAPRLPALKSDLGLDNGDLGIGLSGFAVGSRLVGDALSARVDRHCSCVAAARSPQEGWCSHCSLPIRSRPSPGICSSEPVSAQSSPSRSAPRENLDRGRSGSQLGVIVTIGYAGSIVAPIVVGWTADAVSLRVALVLPLALALVVAGLGYSVATAARRSEAVTES
jgi:MFS family permease